MARWARLAQVAPLGADSLPMLSLASRLPLKLALGVLILVPLVGMSFFAGSTALDEQRRATEAEELQVLVELSVRIGDLLHETQKERGATALFVSSGGTRFVTELPDQHVTTDGPRTALVAYVDEHRAALPASVLNQLSPALDDLGQVDARRTEALGLEAPAGELIGWYTAMNGKLLDAVAATATATSDAQLRNDVLAYVTFLNAKERTGIERAQLSAVFTNNAFAPGQFATVVSLIATQNAYLALLEDTANPEVLAFYQTQQADPVVAEVAALEAVALETDTTAEDFTGFGVRPEAWFDTITQRINLLKDVEDFQADGIRAAADDLAADASQAALVALGLAAASLALSVLLSVIVAQLIVARLRVLAHKADQIATGDLTVAPIAVHLGDEIGRVGRSFNQMIHTLQAVGAQAERIANKQISDRSLEGRIPGQLGVSFQTMTASLRHTVDELGVSSAQLASAAEQLSASSTSVGQSAELTSTRALQASDTGHEVSASVGHASTAIDEVNNSIAEVAHNADQASKVADQAVEVARRTSASIAKLDDSSEEIGTVIKVINSIAEQTNLLALNATIEAARAGEAGKGFAVVANEVKELANQTSQATEEISRRIETIQADTSGAVAANEQIGDTINRINEISTSIAAAVNQQKATTAGIGHAVDAAARGTVDISRSVEEVVQVAGSTSSASAGARTAAEDVARMATHLRELVNGYS